MPKFYLILLFVLYVTAKINNFVHTLDLNIKILKVSLFYTSCSKNYRNRCKIFIFDWKPWCFKYLQSISLCGTTVPSYPTIKTQIVTMHEQHTSLRLSQSGTIGQYKAFLSTIESLVNFMPRLTKISGHIVFALSIRPSGRSKNNIV